MPPKLELRCGLKAEKPFMDFKVLIPIKFGQKVKKISIVTKRSALSAYLVIGGALIIPEIPGIFSIDGICRFAAVLIRVGVVAEKR
jgi:hypothetical protein